MDAAAAVPTAGGVFGGRRMSRPRIRTIKPETWADEKIGRLSRDARLLFVGLITMADDAGRLRAMPSAVLGHIFPYDADAARRLEKWFRELEMVGLVLRYEHLGIGYAWLPGWEKHQRINRPGKSELPPPPSLNEFMRVHDSITDQSLKAS